MSFNELHQQAKIQFQISKNTYLRTGKVDSFLTRVAKLVGKSVDDMVKETV